MNVYLIRRSIQWLLIFLLIGFWVIVHLAISTPFYVHYDPEMAYSLSSLGIFKGINYTYIDHPGTPVEIIGSALYALTFPSILLIHQSFVEFHVAHPEIFLDIARAFLTIMSVVCAVLLFRFSIVGETWLDVLKAFAVALSFYMLHPQGFESLVTWSHNSFAFPFGTLLLLLLLTTIRAERPFSWKYAWFLGFCAGILTSVQLYFATWVVGVTATLVILNILENRNWYRVLGVGLVSGAASIIGFFIATLPILPQYPLLLDWITRLIFHQGRYGDGKQGIISLESLSASFTLLWDGTPVLFVATGLIITVIGILLIVQRRSIRQNAKMWSIALGLAVQLIVTLALVLKHPGGVYMLGVAAIFPVLLAAIFSLIGSVGPMKKFITMGACILILSGAAANFLNAVESQTRQRDYYSTLARSVQRHIDDHATSVGKNPKAIVVLWTYPIASPCYARMFGNDLVFNHGLGAEVARVCKNEVQFNIWNNSIYDAAGTVQSQDFHWDMMIVSSYIFNSDQYSTLRNYGKAVKDSDNGLVFVINERVANNR